MFNTMYVLSLNLLLKLFKPTCYIRFEVFTEVAVKNDVSCDVTLCRSCVNLRFGGTYRLHLQGRKIREQGTSVSKCSHILTLVPRSRIFLPWRWRRYLPPKRRFTQDLHSVTTQKTTFFKLIVALVVRKFLEFNGTYKIHYRLHKSSAFVCIWSQINPVHVIHSYFFEIYVNVINSFTRRYSMWSWITIAARSKAWTVFTLSNAGIVSSNPSQGMDVCVHLFCVCVVLCVGSGLATGSSYVQGVLPTVYRIKKLKKRPMSNKGL
jgi:hypothetical protein